MCFHTPPSLDPLLLPCPAAAHSHPPLLYVPTPCCPPALQLLTLEHVARARTLGVLQYSLAPMLNTSNSNFFYTTKVCE